MSEARSMAGTSSQSKCQASNTPMKSSMLPGRFQSRFWYLGVVTSATQLINWRPSPSMLLRIG